MANTPIINRSKIMQRAWNLYWDAPYQRTRDAIAKQYNPARFNNCLKAAWAEFKRKAKPIANRIAEIRNEISMLKFKSFRYDIGAMRTKLEAEIRTLEAA